MSTLILKVFSVLLLSAVGALFYRMGGAAKSGRWYDFALNTKARDLGCPSCAMAIVWTIDGFHPQFWWAYLISFGLMFGSLTTYWKKKGTDAKWYHWVFVGLGFSVSRIPLAIMTGDWLGFGIQAVAVTAGVTLWSQFISNAVIEELGRGLIFVSTTALLFLIRKRRKD